MTQILYYYMYVESDAPCTPGRVYNYNQEFIIKTLAIILYYSFVALS